MADRLTRDKYGMLTYKYDIDPDVGFAFHMFCEVGQPWQPGFEKMIQSRGLRINRGFELDFKPYCADFVQEAIPQQYVDNARQTKDVFTYTSDWTHWYVLSRATHRLYCIGRIGGSRGMGRGINYRDRAVERAAQMNAQMRAYYEEK